MTFGAFLRSMLTDNLFSSSSASRVGHEPFSAGGSYATGTLSAEPVWSTVDFDARRMMVG